MGTTDPTPAAVEPAGPALIRRVDLCRGLFAFLVVAAHSYDVCWAIHPEAMRALPAGLRAALFATVQSGFYWVMGFFVISGYCIQLSAMRMLAAGRFPLGLYLKARLTRIMPLYYLGLLFALAVECLVAGDRPWYYPDGVDGVGFVSQLVFVQRLTRTFGAFAPSWTITNELFYYVGFGLLATLAAGSGSRSRPAWVGLGCSVAVGAALVGLYQAGYRHGLVLGVGLLFALGINWFLGALVAIYGPALVRRRDCRTLARAWPLGFVLAVALRAGGRVPELPIDLLLGGTFALLLLRFIALDRADRADPRPAPRWLAATAAACGLASYPTYLFHGPILLAWATLIRRTGLVADWRLTWLVLFVSGVGVGSALGWGLERPIMAWRAGLLARWKRADAARGTRPGPDLDLDRRSPRRPALTQGA